MTTLASNLFKIGCSILMLFGSRPIGPYIAYTFMTPLFIAVQKCQSVHPFRHNQLSSQTDRPKPIFTCICMALKIVNPRKINPTTSASALR